jgi:thiosulfate/3-mercaptopyruvate sulfurtransferase
VVDGNFVESRIGVRGYSIVDARDTTFYQGLTVGGGPTRPHLKGHIASAKNVPFGAVWTDSSYAKSMEELKQIFAKAGVAPGDTVIAYCHIGQQATSAIFGARLLGHPVLLYDGSFEDWSRRPNAKVESTPKP